MTMARTQTAIDLDTILTTYLSAWNATDAGERLVLLERSVTDDIEFIDPMKHALGRDALAGHIAETQAAYPGLTFAAGGDSDGHNNLVRQPWAALRGDEVVLRGLDIDEVAPDGRLSKIIGFFDKP
jgi:hypothetical protein